MTFRKLKNPIPFRDICTVQLKRFSSFGLGLLMLSSSMTMALGQGAVLDIGVTAGMSNYVGDIGDGKSSGRTFIWDLQEIRTRPAFGVFVRHKIDRDGLWWVRGDFMRIHISGHDKHTEYKPRRARNLHFRNRMSEASIRIERDLIQQSIIWSRQRRTMVTVRGFLGLAFFKHNPEAQVDLNNPAYSDLVTVGITSDGYWHSLPELMTEGIDYSDQLQMTTIPFGLSAVVAGERRDGTVDFYIGIELGFRLTNTDYLDDISGYYYDPSQMNPLGAALSSQANEVVMDQEEITHSLANHQWQDEENLIIRGNPSNDDAYGTLVLSFGKVLNGSSTRFKRNRSRYGYKRGNSFLKRRSRFRF